MTREEKALIYFKDLREQKLKDYSVVFNTAPKDSVVYEAVSAEIEIYDTVIKALEQEPRWISVKDRLPQKSEYGDVLVTFIPTAGILWATVMIARYSDLMGIAKPCFHIGEVGKESFENITPQVIAWMPLPEPYKAESEE